ncbi:MAG: rhomboid family intramembrane serine protease [Propionibacteriaceae bacterium]|jgi:membrane associated rhomboid family serine protease|nr:rhomboid family intramembrane serine protease [Propionibacteriaceae bacterium]
MTQPTAAPMGCYRHPQVATWIKCQRCGRPICPQCMISAAVGFQCPDCVAEGMRQTRQNQGPYGGPRSQRPELTTMVIIGINVVVWLLQFVSPRIVDMLMLTSYGRCMAVGQQGWWPGAGQQQCAMLGGEWVPGVATGGVWEVLTSAFAHTEFTHLAFNMVALWFLGPQLERVFGRLRFLAVYLLSALGGSALVVWFSDPQSSTLGASGGIFGLLGALLLLVWRLKGDLRQILAWLGANLVFTVVMPSVSWQGHIGGLFLGIAATAIIILPPREKRNSYQLIGLSALTLLLVALIAARALMLV